MTRAITLNDKELTQIKELGTLPDSVRKKVINLTKPRSSRYGKNKGAGFQLECADLIASAHDMKWDNTDDHSVIKARTMGSSGTDLIMLEPLYSRFPFDIECKACESLGVPATIEQAQSNTKAGRHWLIMWKNKLFDDVVMILPWKAFLWLLKGDKVGR
jgi:hypothetical protein